VKYIFITGGVTSSLGKGIVSATLGALLKARGYKVRIKKMDPYLNVDPGTMSPFQHGEVFVTEDGAETDLDLGHYERFTSNNCNKNDSISAGRIYFNVLEKERRGVYLGSTIQVIPHVTNEIKDFIVNDLTNEDFVICEIGGTVGDIEANPFLEALRQFVNEKGKENVLVIHLTLIPYLPSADELKTKPTQHSVRQLQSLGISPDIILCRSSYNITDNEKKKISLFCNIKEEDVIPTYDCSNIYKIPLSYHYYGLDTRVLHYFKITDSKIDLSKWQEITLKIDEVKDTVEIALVGKYTALKDSYKSIIEAFNHVGIHNNLKINIRWINSEDIQTSEDLTNLFHNIDGILVAPGFGDRGIEGKIKAIQYVREKNIPFLGICLGMQAMVIEYARNVLGMQDAISTEMANQGTPVIALMSEWIQGNSLQTRHENSNKGGTLRLGSYPCVLAENSKAYEIYGVPVIHERHRHRYEVNNNYTGMLEEKGLIFSGKSPNGILMEIAELPSHRWFIGVQFHPELKSRIFTPHPLFNSFIQETYKFKQEKNAK